MLLVTGVDLFAFCCLFFIASYLFYIIYYAVGLYELNPFKRPKPVIGKERLLLEQHIPFIKELPVYEQEKFFKRVAWFVAKKHFIFHGKFVDKHELKLLIGGAGVLLTLGMRNHKYIRSIHKIIVYPSDYYSTINKKHHVGEYNAGLKLLVFASDHLKKGFEIEGDNLNLAIHEFGHALYFETSGRTSWEALRFQWGFRKLLQFQKEEIVIKYLRDYAATNPFEFFSVLLEHFFETPRELNRELPSVYEVLVKMLNTNYG